MTFIRTVLEELAFLVEAKNRCPPGSRRDPKTGRCRKIKVKKGAPEADPEPKVKKAPRPSSLLIKKNPTPEELADLIEKFALLTNARDWFLAGDMFSELNDLEYALKVLRGSSPILDTRQFVGVSERLKTNMEIHKQRGGDVTSADLRTADKLIDAAGSLPVEAPPPPRISKFDSVEVISGKHKGGVGQIMWLKGPARVGENVRIGIKLQGGADKLTYMLASEIGFTDKSKKSVPSYRERARPEYRRHDSDRSYGRYR